MTERRVFVVQSPARRSGPRGQREEKYDLSPAEAFGRLVRILDYGNVPEDPEPTRSRLREAMSDFDWEQDYLLLLGDPVACAQAVAFLTIEVGLSGFMALKWDRRDGCYREYMVG